MFNDPSIEAGDELTGPLRKALVELGILIPTTPEEVALAERHLTNATTPEQIEASFDRLEATLDDDSCATAFMQLHESILLPTEGCISMAARHGIPNLKAETLAKIGLAVGGAIAGQKRTRPKLSDNRETEILELSEDIAREDCTSGPVSPTRICMAKQIKVVHDSYGAGNFDGMLVYYDGTWVILCNCDTGNMPETARERFTLAHELGHFHIPEHRQRLLTGGQPHGSHSGAFDAAESIEELEADTFAANLLMPPSRFVSRFRSLSQVPLQSIATLRKEFDTSLESTAIQTMRHDGRIVAIAKWANGALAWHRIADVFFHESGYRQFLFRENNSLPRDCATAAALADQEDQFDAPIHEAIVTAAFCFAHVATGSKRDILLREEAVRNGRFGVITAYSTINSGFGRIGGLATSLDKSPLTN